METEGIQYLKKIIQLARENNIKVIPFVPPVNYELGERIFGADFNKRYAKNVNKIDSIVRENDLELLEMSYSLKQNE